jgi:hypothetical protein
MSGIVQKYLSLLLLFVGLAAVAQGIGGGGNAATPGSADEAPAGKQPLFPQRGKLSFPHSSSPGNQPDRAIDPESTAPESPFRSVLPAAETTAQSIERQLVSRSSPIDSRRALLGESLSGDSFHFDPLLAARSLELLQDNLTQDSPGEAKNYSAAVAQLLGSVGYLPFQTAGRQNNPDRVLPQATVHERYCVPLTDEELSPASQTRLINGFVPKGLLLQGSPAFLCGTPVESGIFRFRISFQDGAGSQFETSFRVVVAEAGIDETEGELRILTSQLETGQVGAEYVFPLQAEGGKPPYSWQVVGLPADLEFDSAAGLIAGTPQDEGEFPLQIAVTDSAGKQLASEYSLLIRATPIFITTHSLEEGSIDTPYQARFTAQGGVPPYRWELSSDDVPDGLNLDPVSGVFDGVPSEAFDGLIHVRVVDKEEKSDSADIPLKIRPGSLQIVTPALGQGFRDTTYRFVLQASGGTPPYRWSLSQSSLPAGLVLNPSGSIEGSPAMSGDFLLTLLVQDGDAQEDRRSFKLQIQELSPADEDSSIDDGNSLIGSDESQSSGGIDGGTSLPPPPGVSHFAAVPSNEKVGLAWQNPDSPVFIDVKIVRAEGSTPQTPDQGTLIYQGNAETYLDLNVSNDSNYTYVVFAEYNDANAPLSNPAVLSITPRAVRLQGSPNPFADRVVEFSPLDPGCFKCSAMPAVVLGPPQGDGEYSGSQDVVSLGAKVNSDSGRTAPYGGSITLEFTDNIVVNGPGADFTIFENAFRIPETDLYFVEPAIVEVSADGRHFYQFPVDFVPHYNPDGSLNLFNPFTYASGFAGVHPVYANSTIPSSPSPTNPLKSGGDVFDLSDLPGAPLSWIRFVRITATGDGWMRDRQGDSIRHSNSFPTFGASGKGNSGFDLDAVSAVND